MLDPNEDTEWNDVLRSKGILPPKEKEAEITEDTIVSMLEQTIEQKAGGSGKKLDQMNLDELDELEDSEDEAVLEEYRRKRIAEMREFASKAKYGSVREISGQDYVDEVTKAGEGVHVVLHLYKAGIPHCSLINDFMAQLAVKYPMTKFLRAVYSTCIPNFPEKNLPSVFCYFEGAILKQFLGSVELRGMNLTVEEFEYLLGKVGSVPTDITEDPHRTVKDKMFSDLESDHNDW
ncbi:viral IAP-associated factor homolog [Phlebotomus papatasi]|uniref:Phosducin domain-containing protein n=1 Tax=Phlebotomus papatasi TaxID=29031 RepID=A0A1B0CZ25_PHLPP|nr:viral IAP-associated factor homolog [Phlebotomus papatasi]